MSLKTLSPSENFMAFRLQNRTSKGGSRMIRFSIFIILMMLVTGCGSSDNETPKNSLPAPPTNGPEELYPISPNVTYGDGWSSLVIERYIVSGFYNDKT